VKVIKLTTRLTAEEKETTLNYDYLDKTWRMDSTVQKHFNKALKQGWTPLVRFEYEDGTVAGYVLEAPDRAVTIRNVVAKKMSEKQMSAKQLRNLIDE
jgi:hypothetical protein